MSPSAVSPRIAETEQLHQAQRMIGGIGNVLLSTSSQTENGEDPRVSKVNLWGQVMTIRGQILVSSTDDDPPVHPCVESKRPRVYIQNVPVCTGTTRTCVTTCGRGAGIHGDVLNAHTEGVLYIHTRFFRVFSACRNTHKHTPRPQRHTHTPHNTTTLNITTSHGDRERDRERQRKRDKTRQEKMKEERRDKKTREDEREDSRQDKRRSKEEKREDKKRERARQEKRQDEKEERR